MPLLGTPIMSESRMKWPNAQKVSDGGGLARRLRAKAVGGERSEAV